MIIMIMIIITIHYAVSKTTTDGESVPMYTQTKCEVPVYIYVLNTLYTHCTHSTYTNTRYTYLTKQCIYDV